MSNFYTDKQQIINWLDKYGISKYILIPDKQYGFIVNVNSNVNLFNNNLTHIPVKFNEAKGNFYCHVNKLTSLEFSPQIVKGNFDCGNNKFTSLEFCPQTVGNYFSCNNNRLTSLEFCPQAIGDSFYCDNNPKLKKIQKITDFKLIYLEHKKILIAKFSDKLNNDLTNDENKKLLKLKYE